MYDLFTLPNGLRVIGQRIEHFRSVAVGVWVKAGSVDETDQTNGYSHFIEHMLFKGTKTRSACELAQEMDVLGGQVNAFTAKECTCFHAKVMDEHLDRALALLSDILLQSVFDPADLEKEKGVILEEISMVEDSPEDVVHELLAKAHFGAHPLARAILGPVENIQATTREKLLAYKKSYYTPENAVVSLAGNYDLTQVQSLMEKYFGYWEKGPTPKRVPFEPCAREKLYRMKPIEQAHLCLGFDGVPQGTDDVYPIAIMSTILGGGMSSRLFQTIREQMGLAYSVYSFSSSYADVGTFDVYAGTGSDKVQQVIDVMAEQMHRFLREGPTRQEFEQARDQLKGSYVLGLESTTSRMSSIGRNLLLREEVLEENDVIRKIDRTTLEDVQRVTGQVLTSPMSAALIGENGQADYSALDALHTAREGLPKDIMQESRA